MTLTNDALEHQRGGDLLASEISMQQVKALLPELFCCRTIGDGFGASISALFHGIENHGSQGYDENQLISIRFMVQKLAEEPFLSFKDAEAIIDDLENIGFVIDLLEFEILAEALNVEGLS